MKEKLEIYMLCRCIEREYAEELFYKGNPHFSHPIECIKKVKSGNVGQSGWQRNAGISELIKKELTE